MSTNKLTVTLVTLTVAFSSKAQTLRLDAILDSISASHPVVKMYDNEIRSMNEAAKGARSWMPTEFGTGLWMTPYDPSRWKKMDDGMGGFREGMGQYMIAAQQMFPNGKRQDAEAAYMEAMSSVEKERKNASLNELYALAKKNYYEWLVIKKKMAVLNENERVLDFMIKNAEIRYKNGLGKISAYYKAKGSLGKLQNMKIMLESEIRQKLIILNTLMNKDKLIYFDIDTSYILKEYNAQNFDSTTFLNSRSDLKAIDKDINLAFLQQKSEKAKLKPEFGIRYEHMFGFGGLPMQYTLMGMAKIPFGRSTRMSKANVESLKWKAEALESQKQMIVNEAMGMAYGMQSDIEAKKKQITLYENSIIPAFRNNYKTMLLGYEQNTEELFMLYDSWEILNMTQLEYLDQLEQLLMMQVELEKILEIK